jgi:hypothetical protein
MNGPEDEGILLDKTDACLDPSTEKRSDAHSTVYVASTASKRYATDGLTRQAPGTII